MKKVPRTCIIKMADHVDFYDVVMHIEANGDMILSRPRTSANLGWFDKDQAVRLAKWILEEYADEKTDALPLL